MLLHRARVRPGVREIQGAPAVARRRLLGRQGVALGDDEEV